jgi:hypothetical protein
MDGRFVAGSATVALLLQPLAAHMQLGGEGARPALLGEAQAAMAEAHLPEALAKVLNGFDPDFLVVHAVSPD